MVIPLALLLLVEEELVHETLDGMVKFCASVKSAHCVKKMKLSHTSHDSTICGDEQATRTLA
jgi:hypothetical protein